jgi:hypothetical protein
VKKLGLTIFAAAALTLPLGAQVTQAIRADIPFEFVVGNTTEPAGAYLFSNQAAEGTVLMQPLGGTGGHILVTSPYSSSTSPQGPKLVFHRYGNQYFLSRVVTTWTGRDIPMSARERETRKTTVAAARQMQTEIVLATP